MKNIVTKIILLLFVISTILLMLSSFEERESEGLVKFRIIDLNKNSVINSDEIVIERSFAKEKNILYQIIMRYTEDIYFEIHDKFVIGLSRYCYKDKDSISGFGMWLDRLDKKAFSWEWYRQIDTDLFKKLQGEGDLKVEYEKREECWMISKITFLGDHTFRAKKNSILDMFRKFISSDNHEDDWNCIIYEGSNIRWGN